MGVKSRVARAAMVTIVPLVYGILVSVGADPIFAGIAAMSLQAPITYVTVFGLYEWWTGRSVT